MFYLLFKIFVEKSFFENFLSKEYPSEKDLLTEIAENHFENAKGLHEPSNI